MATIDLAHLRSWIGRVQEDEDVLAVRHARLMAATVGHAADGLVDGAPLPALWHWLYFLEGRPAGELGRDGHPARGGFLPPVPLPNRMWAGGRIEMAGPLPIGARVKRRSQVLRVDYKQGKSGDLVFVTVLHELLSVAGELLLREEHDIVYTEGRVQRPVLPAPAEAPAAGGPRFTPDAVMLFRYSALTFNGHRIHYDLDYCRHVEGYDNLVIHGPLNATLLANRAEALAGQSLSRFDYRLLAPALLGCSLTIDARRAEGGSGRIVLRMLRDDGVACAEATAYCAV
ncbi:MAG TPA: MaoC family dehydratase N-terminal domain-containing protein [Azospira sp.]|nr:MaoC family dehydratase N-terminal domain-containing protein [Azospira sp.]HNN08425.1 MaoC family dehydratase N-terminal domain-containing protein [Azospira sp.]